MQETQVQPVGREDPLEEEMATHSSILVWGSHGQESLVGYSPWGVKESETMEWLSSCARPHQSSVLHALGIPGFFFQILGRNGHHSFHMALSWEGRDSSLLLLPWPCNPSQGWQKAGVLFRDEEAERKQVIIFLPGSQMNKLLLKEIKAFSRVMRNSTVWRNVLYWGWSPWSLKPKCLWGQREQVTSERNTEWSVKKNGKRLSGLEVIWREWDCWSPVDRVAHIQRTHFSGLAMLVPY